MFLPCKDVPSGVGYRSAGCMEALYVNSMNWRTGLDFIQKYYFTNKEIIARYDVPRTEILNGFLHWPEVD